MPGRGRGSCTLRATTVVAVIVTRGAMTDHNLRGCWLEKEAKGVAIRSGYTIVARTRRAAFREGHGGNWSVRRRPSSPPSFRGPLPVFLTKCPFAVDTHAFCAVGFGWGSDGGRATLWRRASNLVRPSLGALPMDPVRVVKGGWG
jgi:hypothetical protein